MPGVPRLIFSARAVERLQSVIEDEADSGGLRLRVSVFTDEDEQKFGFSLDREAGPEDTIVEFGAIEVIVDEASAAALDGSEIDYLDDEAGERFVVRAQQQGW